MNLIKPEFMKFKSYFLVLVFFFTAVSNVTAVTLGNSFVVEDVFVNNLNTISKAMTTLRDGRFVVTWAEEDEVINGVRTFASLSAQIFNPDGTKFGDKITVVFDPMLAWLTRPSLASTDNGGFVITWEQRDFFNIDHTGSSIFTVQAKAFNSNGTPTTSQIIVDTGGHNHSALPDISPLSNGRFIVTWKKYSGNTTSASDVYAQIYNVDGSRVGNEFLVNSTTSNDQVSPSVTKLSDGRFVIAWQDASQSASTTLYNIRAQLFTVDGVQIGSEFLVDTTDENNFLLGNNFSPEVTALAYGRFLVSWTTSNVNNTENPRDMHAQLFNSDGTRSGIQKVLNTTILGNQEGRSIVALNDGRFVAIYDHDYYMPYYYGALNMSNDIRAQIFNIDGSRSGEELMLTMADGVVIQFGSMATLLNDGSIILFWTQVSIQQNTILKSEVGGRVINMGTDGNVDLDSDSDGMPDSFEDKYGLNKNDPADARFDKDNDSLMNLQEFQIGTKPIIQDTDGDGVDDGIEHRRGTNPLDLNSRPTPSMPIGLNAQWGTVVPGLLNATLGWQHPGFRADGHNAEGVDKFILYRRKLLPDIDCHFNGFFFVDCLHAVYDQVGEAPADRPGAVFTNLEDLVEVLDGWQFAVSAINKFGEESDKSDDVVVVPFKDSETLRIKPPTEPILFVHGIAGNSATWLGAANTLSTLYQWTEGELSIGDPILIQPGNFYRFTFPDPLGPIDEQGVHIGKLLNAISPNKKAILVAHSQGGLASRYYLQVVQKELGIPNRVSRLVTYGTPHQGSNLDHVVTSGIDTLNRLFDLAAFKLDVNIPLFGHFEQPFDPLSLLRDGVQKGVSVLKPLVDINSPSACDLNPTCSNFISTISNFASNPLPDLKTAGITYVSLQGRVALLSDEIAVAATLTGNPIIIKTALLADTLIRDTDLVVSRDNQDLSQVPNINVDIKDIKQIKVFTRDPVNHFVIPKFKEGDDYIGVLMGLGYPVLSIQVHSPVTVAVVDPNGHFIAPQVNNLPGATYTFTGGVEIPMPIAGDYKIIVIPDPSALPTDTYTLDATLNGKTEVLVQDQQIKDIPPQGFIVPVTPPNKPPTANAGSYQTVRLGSLVTLNGSASSDTDNAPSPLSYVWTKTAGSSVSLTGATTAKPQFTPTVKEFYTFGLIVNDGLDNSTSASVKITVPTLGDIDLDGDVDSNDLAKITAALNKPANGPNDLRDINGDMKLDALDTRKLVLLCTKPRCATQ